MGSPAGNRRHVHSGNMQDLLNEHRLVHSANIVLLISVLLLSSIKMSPKRCIVTFDDQLQSLSASPRKVPRTGTLSAPSHPDVFTNTAEGEVIHLSIDYGTKNLPVAYRLGPPTDNARDIHMVWYSFKHPEAPQRAAWLPDGTFLWGFVSL